MGFPALFPKRSPRGGRRFVRRRTSLKRSDRLGWETLGYGLGGHEALEQRALMAADLSLSFDNNLTPGIERAFYSPGMQVVYTLKVTNNGDAIATDALVKTSLASTITGATWTAAYTGNGTGLFGGAGNLGEHAKISGQGNSDAFATTVTLPSKATATFRIVGTIAAGTTGSLSSTASVTLGSDPEITKTDIDSFVPRSLAVGSNGSWTTASTVKLVGQDSKATAIAGPVTPFAGVRSGVRSVLVDLTGDGKDELVTVANYGGSGKVAVYSQNVAGDGTVTLVKASGYDTLAPFGPLARGMSVVAGDFDGDGLKDLGFAHSSGDGEVRLYRSTPTQAGSPLTFLKAFKAFDPGTAVTSLGAGDFGTFDGTASDPVRHDGKDEIVAVGTGKGGPVARVYQVAGSTPSVIDTISPFAGQRRSAVSVEVARLNAGSNPDLIFSAGAGGGSAVEMYDGTIGTAANTKLATLAAFSGIGSGRPVFSAAIDTDGDTRADTIDFVQGGGSTTPMVRYSVAVGTAAGSITATKLDSVAGVAGSLRSAAAAAWNDPSLITTSSGLMYKVLVKGTGIGVGTNTKFTATYAGYNSDGDRFDSGTLTNQPISNMIPGFSEGLKTMTVGSKSQFVIPASLGYGSGAPSNGKPIIFVVDLLAFAP
jgi:uncharacterized repeat protein (TIGR01451 family)